MHIVFEKALRVWIQYMLMLRALYRGFLTGFLPQYSSFLLQYPLLFRDVSFFWLGGPSDWIKYIEMTLDVIPG